MLEILGRIELLLYVPGMRELSACWLDGDGIFGVGRGWYGWVFYIPCPREPSVFLYMSISRNGRCPSSSISMVNCMLLCIPFR